MINLSNLKNIYSGPMFTTEELRSIKDIVDWAHDKGYPQRDFLLENKITDVLIKELKVK